MKDNSGPAHTIRAGRVLARIYRNHDAQRGDWYSVSVVRVFKGSDGKSGTAVTLGRDDLLAAAEVCREAWRWVVSQGDGHE